MRSLFLFVITLISFVASDWDVKVIDNVKESSLYEYVYAADPLFSWNDTGKHFRGASNYGEYDAYILNVTSGTYLNETIVNHWIWWHFAVVIKPKNLQSTDKAMFWTACIDVGSNSHPDEIDINALNGDIVIASFIATHLGIPAIVIFTNPNQPITYWNDPQHKGRSYDSLLAYSFNQSMFFGYPPILFAMARANVRIMDAVQNYSATKFGWDIKQIGTAGASKWGWTTWLFAAIDDRVTTFIPIVFDMLNWNKNAHHQYMSYNGWTWAFGDYWENGLTAYLDTQMEADLFNLIDPLVYTKAYEGKQKCIISDGRDQFFMPDDSWYWWPNMTDPKHYLFLPNTGHAGITGLGESLPAISTFIGASLYGIKIPSVTWTLDHDNYIIKAQTDTIPFKANVWYAPTCNECNNRRDWRAENLDDPCPSHIVVDGKCYNAHSIYQNISISYTNEENGIYNWEFTMPPPKKDDWSLFMIDFRFNLTTEYGWPIDVYGEFEFSTQVMVSNNTLPFADCSGIQCNGTLV